MTRVKVEGSNNQYTTYVKVQIGEHVFTPDGRAHYIQGPGAGNTSAEFEHEVRDLIEPWEKDKLLAQRDLQNKKLLPDLLKTALRGPRSDTEPLSWDYYDITFDPSEVGTQEDRDRAFAAVRDWATRANMPSVQPRTGKTVEAIDNSPRLATIQDWHGPGLDGTGGDGARQPHLRVAIQRVAWRGPNQEEPDRELPEVVSATYRDRLATGARVSVTDRFIKGDTYPRTIMATRPKSELNQDMMNLSASLARAGFTSVAEVRNQDDLIIANPPPPDLENKGPVRFGGAADPREPGLENQATSRDGAVVVSAQEDGEQAATSPRAPHEALLDAENESTAAEGEVVLEADAETPSDGMAAATADAKAPHEAILEEEPPTSPARTAPDLRQDKYLARTAAPGAGIEAQIMAANNRRQELLRQAAAEEATITQLKEAAESRKSLAGAIRRLDQLEVLLSDANGKVAIAEGEVRRITTDLANEKAETKRLTDEVIAPLETRIKDELEPLQKRVAEVLEPLEKQVPELETKIKELEGTIEKQKSEVLKAANDQLRAENASRAAIAGVEDEVKRRVEEQVKALRIELKKDYDEQLEKATKLLRDGIAADRLAIKADQQELGRQAATLETQAQDLAKREEELRKQREELTTTTLAERNSIEASKLHIDLISMGTQSDNLILGRKQQNQRQLGQESIAHFQAKARNGQGSTAKEITQHFEALLGVVTPGKEHKSFEDLERSLRGQGVDTVSPEGFAKLKTAYIEQVRTQDGEPFVAVAERAMSGIEQKIAAQPKAVAVQAPAAPKPDAADVAVPHTGGRRSPQNREGGGNVR